MEEADKGWLMTPSKHNIVLDSASLAPWYENMTSSTKPEVHNATRGGLSHGHRRHAQKIWQSSVTWIFELCKQTDSQTDSQTNTVTTILHTPHRGKVI